MQTRREMLARSASVAAALAGLGLLPQAAQAAWSQAAFDAKTMGDLMKALGTSGPTESKDVTITGPDIAENGAVALIDGQDPREPLRLNTIGPAQYKGMLVLDRWMVEPSLEDLVTDLGPNLGQPKYYRVTASAPALRRGSSSSPWRTRPAGSTSSSGERPASTSAASCSALADPLSFRDSADFSSFRDREKDQGSVGAERWVPVSALAHGLRGAGAPRGCAADFRWFSSLKELVSHGSDQAGQAELVPRADVVA